MSRPPCRGAPAARNPWSRATCSAARAGTTSRPFPHPGDRPTVAITIPGPSPAERAPAAGAVEWPPASEADSSDLPSPTHRPTDLPGTDSGGKPLPTAAPVAAQAAVPSAAPAAVRFDEPDGPEGASGDFELAAPDPRTAEHTAAATAPGGKICVACRSGRVDTDGYCENCGHAQPRERDHMEQELGSVAAVSDRGLRHHRNEDAFAVSSTALPDGSPAVVAIVCDGVSSASRPDRPRQPRRPRPTRRCWIPCRVARIRSRRCTRRSSPPPRPSTPWRRSLATRWSTIRTAIRTPRPAPWSARSRRASCWSSAGWATAASTGCPRTAPPRPSASRRTTPGPRRWWRRV